MGNTLEQAALSMADATDLLRRGIAAAKAGNKQAARALLLEASKLDPRSELAWVWLAWVAENPQDAVLYLEKVLEINPANKQAVQWLSKIRERPVTENISWHCPLCGVGSKTKVVKCAQCRAVLDLTDLDSVLNNPDVDKNLVQEAIERLEKAAQTKPDHQTFLHLSLALLNLNQLPEGIAYLRGASKSCPDDHILHARVQVLERRAQASQEVSQDRQRKKTVFVIDDSSTVRKIVAVTLERQGYTVVTAPDGVQALSKLEETHPDLILLDITMPYMDGYQVCKVLKNNKTLKSIPILMLSGKDGFFDKVRGRMAGAAGHISKPVEPNTLLGEVQRHLKAK